MSSTHKALASKTNVKHAVCSRCLVRVLNAVGYLTEKVIFLN